MRRATYIVGANRGGFGDCSSHTDVATRPESITEAHVVTLRPSYNQTVQFRRFAGAARWAYNWGLSQWRLDYSEGGRPSYFGLSRRMTSWGKGGLLPGWLEGVPRSVCERGLRDLDIGYRAFFKSNAQPPVFHGKSRTSESFYVHQTQIHFSEDGTRVTLHRQIGRVKLHEAFRFPAEHVLGGRIHRDGKRWVLSVQVRSTVPDALPKMGSTVGIDLGLKTAVVLSTGEKIEAPEPLKHSFAVLCRAQRKMARTVVWSKGCGSNRHVRAAACVRNLHARVRHIRQNWLHNLTTRLVREFDVIGIEDLCVKGFIRVKHWGRKVADIGLGEFRRQLEYKAKWYGKTVVVADRFFPSTKTCSRCGSMVPRIALKERSFRCPDCGFAEDRDVNAALNLEAYARWVFARGGGSSGFAGNSICEQVSVCEA